MSQLPLGSEFFDLRKPFGYELYPLVAGDRRYLARLKMSRLCESKMLLRPSKFEKILCGYLDSFRNAFRPLPTAGKSTGTHSSEVYRGNVMTWHRMTERSPRNSYFRSLERLLRHDPNHLSKSVDDRAATHSS